MTPVPRSKRAQNMRLCQVSMQPVGSLLNYDGRSISKAKIMALQDFP